MHANCLNLAKEGFCVFFPLISPIASHLFLPLISTSLLVVLPLCKVGHTKSYVQVLIVAPESMLGTSAIVKITSVGRWSVFGEVVETLNQINEKTENASLKKMLNEDKCSPCSDPCENSSCSRVPEPCACGPKSCEGQNTLETSAVSQNIMLQENRNRRNLIGWLLRKRKNQVHQMVENGIASASKKKQEWARGALGEWGVVDRVLLGAMLVSFLTIIFLLMHLGLWTK